MGVDDEEDELMTNAMPASTQWLAAMYRRDRAHARVIENEESGYFDTNVSRF